MPNTVRDTSSGMTFSLLKCEYCHRLGANLTSCQVGCKRSFHTKCGVDNMAVLQFGGQFDTFCADHVPEHRRRPEPEDNCVICLGVVVNDGEDFKPALAEFGGSYVLPESPAALASRARERGHPPIQLWPFH
ncbi:pineapple eye protein-like [Drosophila kikkawai]|uniref:Pineapple eye protein-like n=1 Tax=Drosophila kikkawai TaxID=30033 RepID=A0ABM4GPE2_DROKI